MKEEKIIERCEVTSQEECEKHKKNNWDVEATISEKCIKMIRKTTKSSTVKFPKEL
jgi:hypothetical protein